MASTQLEILDDILSRAASSGADAADAMLVRSASTEVSCREGKLESSTLSESATIGLRVFVGKRTSIVSTSEFAPETIAPLVERAVATAKLAPEDPYAGLLAVDEQKQDAITDLDLADEVDVPADALLDMALAAEEAALAVAGVTQSGGCGSSRSERTVALATSTDFRGEYKTTGFGTGISALAGEGTGMEMDWDMAQTHHLEDLRDAADIGRTAGERAAACLGGAPIQTCEAPVVFDPRVSNTLLGHFAGAINGSSVALGMSFLKDAMGKQVFADGIQVIDDPLRSRGLGSCPFDAEGAATRYLNLVEDGVLQSWLLDAASARQLGLATTGSARRSPAGNPSPSTSNLYMDAGVASPKDLIADIKHGIFVTGLIGQGVNGVTGDYSRGANGFLISDGKMTTPVKGITIAGNLRQMFLNMVAANDLEFLHATNAPTLRVDGMTIAGE